MRSAAIVALLVCLGLWASGGAAWTSADLGATDPPDPLHERVETDRIVLIAAVQSDGDARWQIEYRTNLDDENTTEAFESLQRDIQADPDNFTDRFAERIRSTVRTAENATGREMTASGFDVAASIDAFRDQGVITYTFEWSNFARPEGDQILVGDAIAGFALYDDTRLEIQWPEGYELADVAPPPSSSSNRSVVWTGTDVDFGPDQPSVTLAPAPSRATPTATATETGDGGAGTTTGTDDGTTSGATTTDGSDGTTGTESPTAGDDTGGGDAGGGGGGGLTMGLFALVVVLVAVGGLAYWRRPGDVPVPGGDGSGPAAGEPAANGAGAAAVGAGDDTTPDPGADDREADDGADPPVDPELLSNEERVLHLLERNGGRMKQQEVVDELGWTEAKTSQVVTGMREDDRLDSFRLGRENVLTLPDTEIDPTGDDDTI